GDRVKRTRVLLALAPLALAGACAAVPATASEGAPSGVILSNERDLTTWAYSLARAPIYAHPDRHARRIDHVHLETEDGYPEVYVLLALRIDARGQVWIRLRIPGRPNGRTGWVPRAALGGFHRTRWLIVINLRVRALTAYFAGHVRFRAPV